MADWSWDWLSIMNMDMRIGFASNFVNSLVLMTLLLVMAFFLPVFLRDEKHGSIKKGVCLPLVSIFFLLIGILSTDIITFFAAWLISGIVNFIENNDPLDREKISKFFYLGMDNFLMFSSLLLFALAFSSSDFDIINKEIINVAQKEKGIIYSGFFLLSAAIFIRSSLFPFLFNYRKNCVEENPSVHTFHVLTIIPLGYILTIKINQAMNIPFFSNMFFVLGMTTSFILLCSALTKENPVEILNLENGSFMGVIYALVGLGHFSTSLVVFISFILLKSSINMLFLTASKKNSNKEIFLPMVLLVGAYVGIPGLTHFFLFFDAAWMFWAKRASPYFFVFVILHGILYVKLLSIIFDFKNMFSTGAFLGKLKGQALMAIFPGLLSLLMIFYCIPSNLASTNDQILKNKISLYFRNEFTPANSIQEQNIVMILLFLSIAGGVLLGGYFYVFRQSPSFLITLKEWFFWVNKLVDYDWGLNRVSQSLLMKKESRQKNKVEALAVGGLEMINVYIGKIIVCFKKIKIKTVDALLMQIFFIMGFSLLVILWGLGWKNFF